MQPCELLAPAGGREALTAALRNGADAVYFGGPAFNARANAENFVSVEEVVRYCHLRGARAYLTVNTLVRDTEFGGLDALLREAYECGVDALIVQDIAVALRAKEVAPGLPLHASTQAGIIGKYGARWAKDFGFERVVLARECSLDEISEAAGEEIGVEVFVHGALCVAYSGRCLFSSMIGGRSGNRGRCAQPCRLPYQFNGKEGYFLSARDLCLIGELPALIQAGVSALKIEGRMRRPEYVAVATRAYRDALDAALEGKNYDPKEDKEQLMAIFHRGGFTRGYAFGENDAEIIYSERPNHGGVLVGEILKNGIARLEKPLRKGDSIECRPSGEGFAAERDVPAGGLKIKQGKPGDVLFRTNDAMLLENAKKSYAEENRKTLIDAVLTLVPDEAAILTLGDVVVAGEVAQPPVSRPLSEEEAKARIGKFGESPLSLNKFRLEGKPSFMTVSAINGLRRMAVEKWEKNRLSAARRYPCLSAQFANEAETFPHTMRLREKPLLIAQTSVSSSIDELARYADEIYYEPSDWRIASLERDFKAIHSGVKIRIVLPFWLEGDNLCRAIEFARKYGFEIIASSFAALSILNAGFVTDHFLHVFNRKSAHFYIENGAERVTLSPELNLRQAKEIVESGISGEVIVHGRIPLMTLRHCPHRAFSGQSSKFREACERCGGEPAVLTDRMNETFPLTRVRADDGCRMVLSNARVLSMLGKTNDLIKAGFFAWRVISDDPSVTAAYAKALSSSALSPEEKDFTRGHFYRGVE